MRHSPKLLFLTCSIKLELVSICCVLTLEMTQPRALSSRQNTGRPLSSFENTRLRAVHSIYIFMYYKKEKGEIKKENKDLMHNNKPRHI